MASEPARAPATAPNPFAGLRPITDPNALFGRDADFTVVRERIYSGRTTLLFAPSGAGKTSFLLAKLMPELNGEFSICLHKDWADQDPRRAVIKSIGGALEIPESDTPETIPSLLEPFRRAASPERFSNELPLRPPRTKTKEFLLILDQFEEVFQYWAVRPEFAYFIGDLCTIVNDGNLRVRIIISMRDDFLGNLSVFDNRIPDLFNNYYRLKYPTRPQAMEMIRRTAGDPDPDGLRALVSDLATFQRPVGKPSAQAPPADPTTIATLIAVQRIMRPLVRAMRYLFRMEEARPLQTENLDRDFIVPPYLQIVCAELWDRRKAGTRFLAGYGAPSPGSADRAVSRAAEILREFCNKRLNLLGTTRRKDLAARAFDFLMTREGSKMAYQLQRLAEHMGVGSLELGPVLDTLSESESRILRRFKGTDEAWWYELYHDMYAPILYEWKRAYQLRRDSGKRRWWRFSIVAAALLAFWLAPAINNFSVVQNSVSDYPVAAWTSLRSRLTLGGMLDRVTGWVADGALARYWDRRAQQAELGEDRDAAVLLRLQALKLQHEDTPARQAAFARVAGGEYAANLKLTIRPGSAAQAVAFSPDENRILVAGSGYREVWDINSGQKIFTRTTGGLDNSNFVNRADLAGPEGFVVLNRDYTLEFLPMSESREQWSCSGITAYALDRDGNSLFVALANGSVQKWNLDKRPAACLEPKPSWVRADRPPPTAGSMVKEMVLSSDGDSLLVATAGGSVQKRRLSNLSSGSKIVASGELALSAQGNRIAVLRRSPTPTIEILDSSGGHIAKTTDFTSPILRLRFSPGGSLFALFPELSLFDGHSGVLLEHKQVSQTRPDLAERMVAVSSAPIVALLSPVDHAFLEPILRSPADQLSFSPSGRYLVTSDADAVRLWTTEPNKPASQDYTRLPLAVSEDGSCAAFITGLRMAVRKTGDSQVVFSAAVPTVPDTIAVSDGCKAAGASWNQKAEIRLWDVEKHRQIGQGMRSESFDVDRDLGQVFSPDGKRLLWFDRSFNATAELRSTADGHLIRQILYQGFGGEYRFTPDSRLFYTGRYPNRLYWSDSGAETGVLVPGGTHAQTAFDSEDTTMVVGGDQGVFRLKLATPSRIDRVPSAKYPQSLAVSPGGSNIAAITNGALVLSGKPKNPVGQDLSLVRFCQQNPKWLLTVSRAGALQLRDSDGGGPIGSPALIRHTRTAADPSAFDVVYAEFTPDGKFVLAITSQWAHLIRVTSAGLEPFKSRQLSAVAGSAWLLSGPKSKLPRVAVLVSVADIASRLEIVDFEDKSPSPSLPAYSKTEKEWDRKLGLHLEQGEIVPLTPP